MAKQLKLFSDKELKNNGPRVPINNLTVEEAQKIIERYELKIMNHTPDLHRLLDVIIYLENHIEDLLTQNYK